MEHEYRPVEGSILTEEQATAYGSHLHHLREENGGLRPEDVVEDAADPKSPTHDWFEWDDTEAARLHRITQARYLLRSINVVVKVNDEPQVTRLFYNVMVQQRVYVTVGEVQREEDMRRQVLEQALKALDSWRRKYALYQELFPIIEAVGEFLD